MENGARGGQGEWLREQAAYLTALDHDRALSGGDGSGAGRRGLTQGTQLWNKRPAPGAGNSEPAGRVQAPAAAFWRGGGIRPPLGTFARGRRRDPPSITHSDGAPTDCPNPLETRVFHHGLPGASVATCQGLLPGRRSPSFSVPTNGSGIATLAVHKDKRRPGRPLSAMGGAQTGGPRWAAVLLILVGGLLLVPWAAPGRGAWLHVHGLGVLDGNSASPPPSSQSALLQVAGQEAADGTVSPLLEDR